MSADGGCREVGSDGREKRRRRKRSEPKENVFGRQKGEEPAQRTALLLPPPAEKTVVTLHSIRPLAQGARTPQAPGERPSAPPNLRLPLICCRSPGAAVQCSLGFKGLRQCPQGRGPAPGSPGSGYRSLPGCLSGPQHPADLFLQPLTPGQVQLLAPTLPPHLLLLAPCPRRPAAPASS